MIVDFFVALWNEPRALGLAFFGTLFVVALFRFLILGNDWKSLWLGVGASFVLICTYKAVTLIWLGLTADFVEVMARGGWEQLLLPLKALVFGTALGAIAHVIHKMIYG